MAATEAASKEPTAPKRRAKPVGKDDPEVAAAKAAAEAAEAMESLEPGAGDTVSWLDKPVDDLSEIRRYVVGKPPEEGGKDTEYSVYIQQPLGWMARQRFFALVSAALSKAIRASGGEVAGMGDIFGNSGGTIRERGERLMQRDWQDASTFMALAAELTAYVPDLMLEFYCIFLAVPPGERMWAKLVFEQPRDPERNLWGFTDDQHRTIIGTFIDQNYEELRGYFTSDLPAIARRVVVNERNRKARESESAPSKQSNSSGPVVAATA
jgi:hypothetical protein